MREKKETKKKFRWWPAWTVQPAWPTVCYEWYWLWCFCGSSPHKFLGHLCWEGPNQFHASLLPWTTGSMQLWLYSCCRVRQLIHRLPMRACISMREAEVDPCLHFIHSLLGPVYHVACMHAIETCLLLKIYVYHIVFFCIIHTGKYIFAWWFKRFTCWESHAPTTNTHTHTQNGAFS